MDYTSHQTTAAPNSFEQLGATGDAQPVAGVEVKVAIWGKTKVDPKCCAKCKFAAVCMPLGRQAFGWQLKFQNMFVSDWKDPTPCQVVEEMLKLEDLFPMKEFKVPNLMEPPKPQFIEHSWIHNAYIPTITSTPVLHTPITIL